MRKLCLKVFILTSIFTGLFLSTSQARIDDIVHPDFNLSTIPLGIDLSVMGIDFLSDGRMAVVTSDFKGGGQMPDNVQPGDAQVFLISKITGPDMSGLEIRVIADNWSQPTGLTIVDDKIYITRRHFLLSVKSRKNEGRKSSTF